MSLFLLICLIPVMGMAVFGPSQGAANEILAQPPEWNLQILKDSADYLGDHFFGRQELITADAVIEEKIFGESASDRVIVGKEDWLYYAATLEDYQGQSLLSDRQIWAAAHNLKLIEESVTEGGGSFLFTIVPNKNTLYPQFMPDSCVRSDAPSNLTRLEEELNRQGVSNLSLRSAFEEEDRILYHKWDSHWNNLGAALAHDEIVNALGRNDLMYYSPEDFTPREDHPGDLYHMLKPSCTEMDVQLYPNWDWTFTYERPIRSPEDQRIDTLCEGKDGSLFMFRDSFGNTLYPFMAESFGKATFSRAMPYVMELAEADTVVIELVQRNLPWLVQRPAVMTAPQRELELPEETVAEITLQVDGEKISGDLGANTDVDSPVYLVCDGVIYEASLAGEVDNPFTAYLLQAPRTLRVIWKEDGIYHMSQELSCGK